MVGHYKQWVYDRLTRYQVAVLEILEAMRRRWPQVLVHTQSNVGR